MTLRFPLLIALFFVGSVFVLPAQITTAAPDGTYLPLKKCWEYRVENIGRSTVSVSNGTVYVTGVDGRVLALDVRMGSVKWVTELGGRVTALHAVRDAGIAAVTASGSEGRRSTFRLLNPDSGLVKYSVSIDVGDDLYLVSSGPTVVAFDPDGAVIALNVADGSVKWQKRLSGRITAAPANAQGNTLVATDDKKLSLLSNETGTTVSVIPTLRAVSAVNLRENGMIVAGDDRGRVTNYRDNAGGVWWQFKSGARIGTISETEDGMLVGSYDNFLYLVSKHTGDVRWKRRLDGRILSRPAIVGNRILTASATEENAHVIEAGSGRPVDRIAFGEGRFMLAQPYVSDRDTILFTIVDGLTAYAPNGCSPQ